MNQPATTPVLTVYVLPGCAQSARTQQALDDQGVHYVLVDLAVDEQARQTINRLGHTTTPVVIAGTTTWAGHQPTLIETITTDRTTDLYLVPVDPMDELHCDSCQ